MGEPGKTTRRYADAGTDATVADLMHSFLQHISEPILIEVDCAGGLCRKGQAGKTSKTLST
jgi:hypothetical protein